MITVIMIIVVIIVMIIMIIIVIVIVIVIMIIIMITILIEIRSPRRSYLFMEKKESGAARALAPTNPCSSRA